MKTQEQNAKEVMTYLQKSAQNFFQSEDGNHWQAVVYLHAMEKYVFIRDGEVFELNMSRYLGQGTTAGKTFLKNLLHPTFTASEYAMNNYGYGHGPFKKMRAVRWNLAKLELTSTAAQAYLATQTEKGSV